MRITRKRSRQWTTLQALFLVASVALLLVVGARYWGTTDEEFKNGTLLVGSSMPNNASAQSNRETVPSVAESQQENDVCIEGGFFGGTFNQIRTLGNAITTAKNHSPTSLVRLNPQWMRMYHQWFVEAQNTTTPPAVVVRPIQEGQPCRLSHEAYAHFTGELLPSKNKKNHIQGLALLWPHFQQHYVDQAKSALDEYRAKAASEAQSSSSSKMIVTVHSRGLSGQCRRRSREGKNICPDEEAKNWGVVCGYTEEFVKSQLPAEQQDSAIVVLLGDHENRRAERTFAHQDAHAFAVQVAMMVLSDYHFGNPMSTVDTVVAHWRQGHGKLFPEPCYRTIVEQGAREREAAANS